MPRWIAQAAGIDLSLVEGRRLSLAAAATEARFCPVSLSTAGHTWEASVGFCDRLQDRLGIGPRPYNPDSGPGGPAVGDRGANEPMADLVYTANVSLDGYTEDADGRLDWSAPDEDVFSFITELERPAGTYLYGRRMYEAMRVWGSDIPFVDGIQEGYVQRFAEMWRAADKVVFSRSLESVSGDRTRLEHDFDPEAVRRVKATASRPITIGGATLAGQALAAGLVDELRLLVVPVVLGGGKPWHPNAVSLPVRLLETRPFASGVVYLRYRLD